jgi:hypothetical protein
LDSNAKQGSTSQGIIVENTTAIRRPLIPHGPLEEVGREIAYSGLTEVLAERDEPVILG